MNKIICDICGTTYPDSASQCPICGYVKPANTAPAEAVDSDPLVTRRENYTYVKGGRFSKKNVKKRNLRMNTEEPQQENVMPADDEEHEDSGKGLVIAIIVLLIAVIAVASYITIRFFAPFGGNKNVETTQPPVVETTEETVYTEPVIETTEAFTEETEITLNATEITLEEKGAEYTLVVSGLSEESNETITYNSANDAIATVSVDGKITAITAGETVVTVTVGETVLECKVICSFSADADNTDTQFKAPYKLNKSDVSVSVGESFTLKFMDANKEIIPVQFEIQKPDVCSMDGNKVTATASGNTKITVTYNGETYSCIVRVK